MTEKIWQIYVPNLQFPHNTSSPIVLPFEPAFKTTALHTPLPPVIPQTGLQHTCTCRGSHFCTTLFLCNDLLSSNCWKPARDSLCPPQKTVLGKRKAYAEGHSPNIIWESSSLTLTCSSLAPTSVNQLPRSTSTSAQVAQKMRTGWKWKHMSPGATCSSSPNLYWKQPRGQDQPAFSSISLQTAAH